MSPPTLFFDLLALVVGLPLVWTLRDLAPHGLRSAGGLSLLVRGGAVFERGGSAVAEPEAVSSPNISGKPASGIFFNRL